MLTREGHDATPVEGAKSQFDVVADGTLLFSKQRKGRFPEEAEIVATLAAD